MYQNQKPDHHRSLDPRWRQKPIQFDSDNAYVLSYNVIVTPEGGN